MFLSAIVVVCGGLMALNGNWLAISPAICGAVGANRFTTLALTITALYDAAQSTNASPFLVLSSAAALTEITQLPK